MPAAAPSKRILVDAKSALTLREPPDIPAQGDSAFPLMTAINPGTIGNPAGKPGAPDNGVKVPYFGGWIRPRGSKGTSTISRKTPGIVQREWTSANTRRC
jgi:hypothetical protein